MSAREIALMALNGLFGLLVTIAVFALNGIRSDFGALVAKVNDHAERIAVLEYRANHVEGAVAPLRRRDTGGA